MNRAFEIVPRSRRDFEALDRTSKQLYAAFVAGINFYLQHHPETRPRLIRRFEPWHVLAYYRHVALELSFRLTGLSDDYMPRRNPKIWAATGSNGWAIAGSRTASGGAMLLANPHMPWYGFAQLMEVHLASEGGQGGQAWNFTGAGFYGSPMPALGRNARLGWTLVTNQPDIADVWRVRFSNPDEPLDYIYGGDGTRRAIEWTETIRVRKSHGYENRKYTFRRTHHGPVVTREDEQHMLAARVCGLFEAVPLRQSMRMVRANNREEFIAALGAMQAMFMNIIYADCDGNIQFIYNCRAPRRNPRFDWSRPVDGSDPAAEWLDFHQLDELPTVLNPAAGFLQNCNSTPFRVTDGENPSRDDFPAYLVGDAEAVNRRSLQSLDLLREMRDLTFEQWQESAFNTEVYWAKTELPKFAELFQQLHEEDARLVRRVQPYLEHLLAWNRKISADSTAATLCHAWYEQLYGRGYPGEDLREEYRNQPVKQLAALVRAAERLEAVHGDWKVPYGDLYRSQRQPRVADLVTARFFDDKVSLPLLGGHGPMGVTFTQYYSPTIDIPLVRSQRRRYGVVGTSYLAAWEFLPDGARGASLVPYGVSGNPRSPHYFDQALLLSQRRLKPELFAREEVAESAVSRYHPGSQVEKQD